MLLFSLFLLSFAWLQSIDFLQSGALFYISSFFLFLRHRLLLFDLPSFTYFRLGRSLWPYSGSSLSRGIFALLSYSVQHARFFVFHWSASVVDFFVLCSQKLPFSPVTSVDHEPFYTFFAERAMFAHFLYSKVICSPVFTSAFRLSFLSLRHDDFLSRRFANEIIFPPARRATCSYLYLASRLYSPLRESSSFLYCSVVYTFYI